MLYWINNRINQGRLLLVGGDLFLYRRPAGGCLYGLDDSLNRSVVLVEVVHDNAQADDRRHRHDRGEPGMVGGEGTDTGHGKPDSDQLPPRAGNARQLAYHPDEQDSQAGDEVEVPWVEGQSGYGVWIGYDSRRRSAGGTGTASEEGGEEEKHGNAGEEPAITFHFRYPCIQPMFHVEQSAPRLLAQARRTEEP